MLDRLNTVTQRLAEIDALIDEGSVLRDQKKYKELMKERAYCVRLQEAYQEYLSTESQLVQAREMVETESDPELKKMAHEEARILEARLNELQEKITELLIPPDPLNDKGIIMEIRAGTGGDEAALFAADLFRMYGRYADKKGWKLEVMSASETELGGYKEIIFSVSGEGVYGLLRYESGVHRVQRVPDTEASGRVHTSAVTVAVLPEVEETEIEIKQEDLRIDVMRAGGPGGQCVNTTDSAVRITHLPTGITVHCQDEKSQIKNKAKVMRILRSRLFELEEEKKQAERAETRKNQIGTGDRSERIRTYNFPQNRVTDHRIDLTLYKLDLFMLGDIEEVLTALAIKHKEEALKAS